MQGQYEKLCLSYHGSIITTLLHMLLLCITYQWNHYLTFSYGPGINAYPLFSLFMTVGLLRLVFVCGTLGLIMVVIAL